MAEWLSVFGVLIADKSQFSACMIIDPEHFVTLAPGGSNLSSMETGSYLSSMRSLYICV